MANRKFETLANSSRNRRMESDMSASNEIGNMTTAEILLEYNTLTGKSVKRFSSRTVAERTLKAARKNAAREKPYEPADGCPQCHAKDGQEPAGEQGTNEGDHQCVCGACGAVYMRSTGEVIKNGRSAAQRAASTSKSWQNPEVAERRKERTKVLVNGTKTYRSVCAAFQDLGLPMGSHVTFRGKLKAAGQLEFDHGDETYEFAVIETT